MRTSVLVAFALAAAAAAAPVSERTGTEGDPDIFNISVYKMYKRSVEDPDSTNIVTGGHKGYKREGPDELDVWQPGTKHYGETPSSDGRVEYLVIVGNHPNHQEYRRGEDPDSVNWYKRAEVDPDDINVYHPKGY